MIHPELAEDPFFPNWPHRILKYTRHCLAIFMTITMFNQLDWFPQYRAHVQRTPVHNGKKGIIVSFCILMLSEEEHNSSRHSFCAHPQAPRTDNQGSSKVRGGFDRLPRPKSRRRRDDLDDDMPKTGPKRLSTCRSAMSYRTTIWLKSKGIL